MFVNELPGAIKTPKTQVFQFADDAAILASSNSGVGAVVKLEKAAANLIKFFDKWKMPVNKEKTEVMFPGRRKKKAAKASEVWIGGVWVKVKRKIRYLGVDLDKRGTMESHVKYRAGLAKMRLGKLLPVLHWESGVSLKTRKKVLLMIAQPSAFYGTEVAVRGSEEARKKLEMTQRVLIRRCLGAPCMCLTGCSSTW